MFGASKVKSLYSICDFKVTFFEEEEGKTYEASRFKLNNYHIKSRKAKITPKKVGQFVTCWKRNTEGITAPFDVNDSIDFLIVNTATENKIGHFVFPKKILQEKGIISSPNKAGKRGFRIYSPWDITTNKQAEKAQAWQIDYFIEINDTTDLTLFAKLYK